MSEKTRARAGGPLVIGTGLPRTGTTSLYEALETLGFTPCHHFRVMTMNDAFPYRDIGLWGKAAKTIDKDERQDMLHHLLSKSGCKAAVDYPTSCFIDDMVEMYPNAKFIHCERSSPEAWRKSLNDTVGRVVQDKVLRFAAALIPFFNFALVPVCLALDERDRRVFGASLYKGLDSQIELYHRHNAAVRRLVPKDKLLEFDSKQGYGPLCEFLEIPVPIDGQGNKLDYPHANDSATLVRRFRIVKITGLVSWCVLLGGAYFVTRRFALF